MPTYVTDMGRITIPYTINSLPHVTRFYVKQPTPTGGTYNIFGRFSVTADIPWKDAADQFAAAISYLLPATLTPDTVLLEQFDGLVWVLRETHTTTFPNVAGSTQVAGQYTATFRDAAAKLLKIVILEGNRPYPARNTSVTGGSGAEDSFLQEFTSSALTSPSPWATVVSHREQFLQAAPFVSSRTTLNEKLEKQRLG